MATNHDDLDPEDWEDFRRLMHQAVDRSVDRMKTLRDRPVWQDTPDESLATIRQALPTTGRDLGTIADMFEDAIAPYAINNPHPRFFGWVHGGGTGSGMLSELLAASINANLGGRKQAPVEVERTVIDWWRDILDFPETAGGTITTGTSLANLYALTAARATKVETDVRADGISDLDKRLTVYASDQTHVCVTKAVEVMGHGRDGLRVIPTDGRGRMNVAALKAAIADDRAQGRHPFCLVGSAGTVNTGMVDPLDELADIAAAENMWFHVDAAFGAMAVLSSDHRALVTGIERADSLAFDFHKWMSVQYDAACLMVRDKASLKAAFSHNQSYLQYLDKGAASGGPWPCEDTVELSRGFRALKVWFSMLEHGTEKIGRQIDKNCAQAQALSDAVEADPAFELACRTDLNVVCFRHLGSGGLTEDELAHLNIAVVEELHVRGLATPSHTTFKGKVWIRMAIVNHRTRTEDVLETLAAISELAPTLQLSSA